MKAALDAPLAAKESFSASTTSPPPSTRRSWPSHAPALSTKDGRTALQARTVHYRGILGFEGLYADLHEVGGLSAYASRVEDLVDQQRARYRAWFAAMDRAGWSAGSSRRRGQSAQGFVEPGAFEPPRHRGDQEHGRLSRDGAGSLRPHPWRCGESQARKPGGKTGRGARPRARWRLLHVPIFSYLNGELLAAAVTAGYTIKGSKLIWIPS